MPRVQNKECRLKDAREKCQITDKTKPIIITAHISWKTLNSRRARTNVFKPCNKITANKKYYIQQNYHFK
jgi:hypothetical protein